MGKRHALNTAYAAPRTQLVAVCDPYPPALQWAKENLPQSTEGVSDFKEIFERKDIDAVIIATATSLHAPLAIQALQAGKHVLLEKPISVDVKDSLPVIKAVEEHPHLKLMIGLSRRFDQSYREVKKMIDAGQLGKPYLIRSCTNDQYDPSGFFVSFSEASGGIIVDCGIHDIDIARYLLGISEANVEAEVKRVFAVTMSVHHPELEKTQDADNAVAVVEFTNGAVCNFHLSRTSLHGHECYTEIYGSTGKAVVNGNPSLNRVEIRDQYGVRTESHPTYYERFKEAFVTEINEFAACCLDDKPVPVSIDDAVKAAKIADALTISFRTGQPVFFDEQGQIIPPV